MIYLAAPYSHPDPKVREERYQKVCEVTAILIRAGFPVFSPITHSHPLVAYGLPTDWEFWSRWDEIYLKRSDAMIVLTFEGWEKSQGVQAETAMAKALGISVMQLDPDWVEEVIDYLASRLPRIASVVLGVKS
jgi:nucleoside 2-deoxyribosyltransferase